MLDVATCPGCKKVMELGRRPDGDRLYVCTRCLSGYLVPASVPAHMVRAEVHEQERKFNEVVARRNTAPVAKPRRPMYFK